MLVVLVVVAVRLLVEEKLVEVLEMLVVVADWNWYTLRELTSQYVSTNATGLF